MISIIVPVYNAEKYLSQCIESILNQSEQDFELLLVNDGSTDKSLEICNEYAKKDDRIKVLSQSNKGTVAARKLGTENASGEYITFCDSDDFIDKNSFSLALNDMNSEMDIIIFGIYRYYNDDYIIINHDIISEGIYDRSAIEKDIFSTMIWDEKINSCGIDPSLSNKFYKSTFIKKIYKQINEELPLFGGDVSIIYPLLYHAQKISVHHEAYYYHRQRVYGEVASYLTDSRYLDNLYILYNHLRNYFKDNDTIIRQVELFYVYSAQLALVKYDISLIRENVIFPFDKVEKNDRVIIYGAGKFGKIYIDQLSTLNYCKVVLWVDINYMNMGSEVSSPKEILNTEYDKIVISVNDIDTKNKIKKYLTELGVDESEII